MKNIKSVFIGPTEHAKICLDTILKTPGYTVEAVFGLDSSWKDKKARWTSFEDMQDTYGFKLIYDRIKNPASIELIKQINPDVIFEFGASELIPKEILDIPKYGCIGSHGGPLPDIKGGSSLNWALIMDKKEWGVSLYYLAEKADEGDIIGVGKFNIEDRDDINTVHHKSDYQINEILKTALADLRDKAYTTRIKPTDAGIFLPQRKPKDGLIDWNTSPREIFNFVRAQTHPFPGAFAYLYNISGEQEKVHIWKADYRESEVSESSRADIQNGTCFNVGTYKGKKGLIVKCVGGDVLIERISRLGGTEMWGDDFFKATSKSLDFDMFYGK